MPRQWIGFLRDTFGLGFFVVPIVLLLLGLWLVLRKFEKTPRLTREQIAGLIVLFVVALISMGFIDRAAAGSIGTGLLGALTGALGQIGSVVLLAVGWLIAIVLLFDVTPSEIATRIARGLRRIKPAASHPPSAGTDWSSTTTPPMIQPGQPVECGDQHRSIERQWRQGRATRSDGAGPAAAPRSLNNLRLKRHAMRSRRACGRTRRPRACWAIKRWRSRWRTHLPRQPPRPRLHPPARCSRTSSACSSRGNARRIEDIFESGEDGALSEDDLRENARIIEDTLQAFGVEGKVIEVNRGPAITQFGVEPGFVQRGGKITKVKVSKITALADDLALALAAKTIRIEAPVPGKNIVGIEVPNHEIATVALRDVIESESFQKVKHKGALPIALGQDVSGQADRHRSGDDAALADRGHHRFGQERVRQRHHLVPDVALHAQRTALLDGRSQARGTDHLQRRAASARARGGRSGKSDRRVELGHARNGRALSQVCQERLAQHRRLQHQDRREQRQRGRGAGTDLPYIVVVIDELADLMMLAPDETEKTICRLAQMARATGIHLIIATQRPSVDVVTGLIKANFPARIAFSVASSIDSRVILDTTGAERLLGRGDMLYVAPEVGSPQRLQGCFVSDQEIHKLVRYWKSQHGAEARRRAESHAVRPRPSRPRRLRSSRTFSPRSNRPMRPVKMTCCSAPSTW